MSPADAEVVDRWWRAFAADGVLPGDLPLVQRRLVRAVHTGSLPSGPVYVKVMTFPRAKDRLRYSVRALPARHEAAMLAAVAAAGIPCPAVAAVRTSRRAGLPSRSMLVLRALQVARRDEPPLARFADEAALAARLLAAGIHHPDLHGDNFVRLEDGRLAVLDLQSARRVPRPGAGLRVAAAARLLQDRADLPRAGAAEALQSAGLVRDPGELDRAFAAAERARRRFLRGRIRRCLEVGTEFTRRPTWLGIEHRMRDCAGGGWWWPGGRELRRAWLGQRAAHLLEGRDPLFRAYLRKWWWFGGGGGLYAPAASNEEQVRSGVRDAMAAYVRHRRCIEGRA